MQDFCNDPAGADGNQPIILPGWPDVLLPRQSQPGNRSRLQSDSVHHPGLGFSNAKQFPNVNLDRSVDYCAPRSACPDRAQACSTGMRLSILIMRRTSSLRSISIWSRLKMVSCWDACSSSSARELLYSAFPHREFSHELDPPLRAGPSSWNCCERRCRNVRDGTKRCHPAFYHDSEDCDGRHD